MDNIIVNSALWYAEQSSQFLVNNPHLKEGVVDMYPVPFSVKKSWKSSGNLMLVSNRIFVSQFPQPIILPPRMRKLKKCESRKRSGLSLFLNLVQPLDLCFSGASFFACLRILCSLLSHESPLSNYDASYYCNFYLTFSFRQHKSRLNPANF